MPPLTNWMDGFCILSLEKNVFLGNFIILTSAPFPLLLNGKRLWLGFLALPLIDSNLILIELWFAIWKWKFLIKCYSDKAHFSEFWSVAPLPSTWKHHFEGKGAWLLGLPGAPNIPKTGVLGAPSNSRGSQHPSKWCFQIEGKGATDQNSEKWALSE